MSTVNCPTCRRPVEWSPESVHRPFCSERCRLVDLGAWFNEERGIPDESPADPDSISGASEES
jgi:uncharacterized protein